MDASSTEPSRDRQAAGSRSNTTGLLELRASPRLNDTHTHTHTNTILQLIRVFTPSLVMERGNAISTSVCLSVRSRLVKLFVIQFGLTFCLSMRTLYEAPLHRLSMTQYQVAKSNV